MTAQASTQTTVLGDDDNNQMNDFENPEYQEGWLSRDITLSDLDSTAVSEDNLNSSVPLVRSYAINIPLDRMHEMYNYGCSGAMDDLIHNEDIEDIELLDLESDTDSMPELEPIEPSVSTTDLDNEWLSGGAEVDVNGNYIRAVDMDYIRRSRANEKDDYNEESVKDPPIRSYALNNEINGYKYRWNLLYGGLKDRETGNMYRPLSFFELEEYKKKYK